MQKNTLLNNLYYITHTTAMNMIQLSERELTEIKVWLIALSLWFLTCIIMIIILTVNMWAHHNQLHNWSGDSRLDVIESELASIDGLNMPGRLNEIEEKKRQYEEAEDSLSYYNTVINLLLSNDCNGIYAQVIKAEISGFDSWPIYTVNRLWMEETHRLDWEEASTLNLKDKEIGKYFCIAKDLVPDFYR